MRSLIAAALLALAAAAKAKYGEAEIIVSGSAAGGKGAGVSRLAAVYPATASGSLPARAGQYLVVQFDVTDDATGEGLAPHQAFVRLRNKATGVYTTFVAAPDASAKADKAGVHKVSLDLSDRKSLYTAAAEGSYEVDIVVGDASIANPVVWSVGSVDLAPPAAPAKPAAPLYSTPLLHESDTTLKPLPTIEHAFRAPEKRPPFVVSLFASGLIVAAFLAWVGYAFTAIPGFRVVVPAAAGAWAAPFAASFAAILGLFGYYWFGYANMFQTVGYASILVVPAWFFGRQMLLALQASEAAAAAAAAGKAE